MKQALLHERYPIYSLEVEKTECRFQTVDEIIAYLREQIEAHPLASYIAAFDHLLHTRQLAEGEANPEIMGAQNIIFCFGLALPSPQVMAVRPRSIGVVELDDRFVVTFMEAPMPVANVVMEKWANALAKIPAVS